MVFKKLYLCGFPLQVTSALIGASRVSQVDDCVGATKNLNFTREELNRIEKILA